ncbi:MAG TPA: ribonuclease R [Verrucomicrobiales bacterium]|nr:ribonuclease R [Verrucomicrobiales bacterium]
MKTSLEDRLKRLLAQPGYRPLNRAELARTLEIPSGERSALRELLNRLESSGQVVALKKGRFALQRSGGDTVAGVFRFSGHRGHGEVTLDPGTAPVPEGAQTLFVFSRNTLTALEGDRVLVRLEKGRPSHWLRKLPAHVQKSISERLEETVQGPRAKVIKILERSAEPVVGTFHRRGRFLTVVPDEMAYPEPVSVEGVPEPAPADGDKVLIRITAWESRQHHPRGQVVGILGKAGDPGVDILSIIHRYRLRQSFSAGVQAEAETAPAEVTEADLNGREDWRAREVITIDPFDARDFDDAICVGPRAGGGWELAVHIADVAHYVRSGSELDREARRRGNSVYLVDRVLPMLPEALSNGICSLKPDVDRLTHAVVMQFDARGRRDSVRFASAVIRSAKRLTYEEAYQRLGGPAEDKSDPVTAHLHRAWALAARLREARFDTGALDLDFPEIKVILEASGKPVELRRIDYDESHQLIEEFMLAANEAVAETIRRAEVPSLYRIHEDPDEERLLEFRDLARLYGHAAGDLTVAGEVQKLLRSLRGAPEEHALKVALLKSLKRAVYSSDPLGHYGLAKDNYTHFTSPIRRYADLVVHRILRRLTAGSSGAGTPNYAAAAEIAVHVSTTERNAADAEQESKRLKIAEYFDAVLHDDPDRSFPAIVVDAMHRGLMVELTGLMVKGLVKVADLPPGDYVFEPGFYRFTRAKPREHFGLGDRLHVRVARVDFERHFIDFRVALELPRQHQAP